MKEISGKSLILREMTQKEMRALWRKYIPAEGNYSYDEEAVDARFEKLAADNGRNAVFGIFTKNGEIIGEVELSNIVFSENRCDISLFLANESYRKKGNGFEALNLAKKLAHEQLGLTKMYAEIKHSNSAAIALFKKCGFSNTKNFKTVAVYFLLLK